MTALWKAEHFLEEELAPALIGESAGMRAVKTLIEQVGASNASVLVTGPSGSGKELVARAIHQASKRAPKAFVAVNCGAIPRELLESELFGHEKGSFTGAIAQRRGRFECAHGGSLFLDEIGDMPADMQVKLLRVLEERRVERVGGTGSIAIDTRVISATHRSLEERIEKDQFREDLYYRLAVFPIQLPGLAERPEDIPLLVQYFVRILSHQGTVVSFTPGAMAQLITHAWRGNVRELRNVVERASILFPNEQVTGEQIMMLLRPRPANDIGAPARDGTPAKVVLATPKKDQPIDLRQAVADLERTHMLAALDLAEGVVAEAARLLTLQRTTFIEKMKRHGIDREMAQG